MVRFGKLFTLWLAWEVRELCRGCGGGQLAGGERGRGYDSTSPSPSAVIDSPTSSQPRLTPLGQLVRPLPLPPRLGVLVILGLATRRPTPCITIAAALIQPVLSIPAELQNRAARGRELCHRANAIEHAIGGNGWQGSGSDSCGVGYAGLLCAVFLPIQPADRTSPRWVDESGYTLPQDAALSAMSVLNLYLPGHPAPIQIPHNVALLHAGWWLPENEFPPAGTPQLPADPALRAARDLTRKTILSRVDLIEGRAEDESDGTGQVGNPRAYCGLRGERGETSPSASDMKSHVRRSESASATSDPAPFAREAPAQTEPGLPSSLGRFSYHTVEPPPPASPSDAENFCRACPCYRVDVQIPHPKAPPCPPRGVFSVATIVTKMRRNRMRPCIDVECFRAEEVRTGLAVAPASMAASVSPRLSVAYMACAWGGYSATSAIQRARSAHIGRGGMEGKVVGEVRYRNEHRFVGFGFFSPGTHT
ncbi:hypothetical protein BDK51DRAFT_46685 [Blyttiomyces helicus]|uniref:Uncharacterized protein n=1 Tax=Blyttiomyces helicus TaxID=388810 RepID=A0A4V1IQN8_9FUNG|nr:hypothetical protein BDK51DRAFT_46685 [Blyttiomyces helicus]|eukprot:RKO87207.1 hypothetical protein BDK51DRAFT_46685 [Blyttiomyces helicus]